LFTRVLSDSKGLNVSLQKKRMVRSGRETATTRRARDRRKSWKGSGGDASPKNAMISDFRKRKSRRFRCNPLSLGWAAGERRDLRRENPSWPQIAEGVRGREGVFFGRHSTGPIAFLSCPGAQRIHTGGSGSPLDGSFRKMGAFRRCPRSILSSRRPA
jgi:hypothetical protein